MIRLTEAVRAWGTPQFADTLKQELEHLEPGQLPLQQGLTAGSHALDDPFTVMVIGASGRAGRIHAKAGIFYSGIIAGCSCADDPTPIDTLAEYCEVEVVIELATGEATVALAAEGAC